MTKSLQLTDGTVLDISVNPMKRWKKFEGCELIITALTTMFPALMAPLDETMYCFLEPESLNHFLTVCLAVSMIHERYGTLPEYVFDYYYVLFGQDTFSLCVNNEGIYCHPEGLSQFHVKQITVSSDAVQHLQNLLSSVEILESRQCEQIVTEEFSGTLYDVSPSVCEPRTSNTRYSLTHHVCPPASCNLCDYLRVIPVQKYGALHKLVPNSGCKAFSYDPQPLETVLSLTRAYGNECVRIYGSSFSNKLPRRIPNQLHELEVDRVRLRVRTLPSVDSGVSLEAFCSGSLPKIENKRPVFDAYQKQFIIT
jgi:hypothetical protein